MITSAGEIADDLDDIVRLRDQLQTWVTTKPDPDAVDEAIEDRPITIQPVALAEWELERSAAAFRAVVTDGAELHIGCAPTRVAAVSHTLCGLVPRNVRLSVVAKPYRAAEPWCANCAGQVDKAMSRSSEWTLARMGT
jgi:hypothetical protein